MIQTIRYGGVQGDVMKDGKKISVQVPPPLILWRIGAVIPVSITHPTVVQEKLKGEGKEISITNTRALIDTGAASTVITPKIAERLGLVHTGYTKVCSVQDEQTRPVYYGFIGFPWGMGKDIPIISCPLKYFDCLIGRDILQHWHFTYNGADGSFTICD